MAQVLALADESPRLPNISAGGSVRAIVPQDFDSAWRIANAVVKSGMAPKGVDTAEKAMIAIMHGLEVGMTPMMALQSIAPINGRPSIYGDGALGLVQGSGLMEWYKEYYRGKDGKDDYAAVCEVKRKGDPEVKTGTFSIADAKLAGLHGKSGPWTQYRSRMLKMRARSFALRDGFSDVLRGLHIAEEMQDIVPVRDVTPAEKPPVPPPLSKAPPTQPALAAPAEERVIWEEEGERPATVADQPKTQLDAGDIPEALRRRPTQETGFDPAEWLTSLENAFACCEDLASLDEKSEAMMKPGMSKAFPPDQDKAKQLLLAHVKRISEGA